MLLKINGKDEELQQETITVSEVLKIKNVEMPETVSVQLNGEFVKKDSYNTQSIKENDELDFLYFMGGGCKITANTNNESNILGTPSTLMGERGQEGG